MINQDDINKEIARRLKVDVKTVALINDKQWKEVEKNLKRPKHFSFKVLFFGSYTVRFGVCKKRIRMLIDTIRKQRKEESNVVRLAIIKDLTEQLRELCKFRNQFAIENLKAKKKKQDRINGK